MKTTVGSLEVFLVYTVILRSAECAITGWTAPSITGATGSGTLANKINDGVTSVTGITVTATSGAGSVTSYAIVSQTPTSPVLAIDNNGAVTATSGNVSYSSVTSFTLVISANDTDSTATATVTLKVNAAPVISSHSRSVCMQDASSQGVNLIDLTATDANSGTNFTWAISSGNTGTAFAITTGRIAVATGKTLDMATTPNFTLVITAADDSSTPLTATTTLTASVQTTCSNGAADVAISLVTVLAVFLVKGLC